MQRVKRWGARHRDVSSQTHNTITYTINGSVSLILEYPSPLCILTAYNIKE